jgi:hypothetical protein
MIQSSFSTQWYLSPNCTAAIMPLARNHRLDCVNAELVKCVEELGALFVKDSRVYGGGADYVDESPADKLARVVEERKVMMNCISDYSNEDHDTKTIERIIVEYKTLYYSESNKSLIVATIVRKCKENKHFESISDLRDRVAKKIPDYKSRLNGYTQVELENAHRVMNRMGDVARSLNGRIDKLISDLQQLSSGSYDPGIHITELADLFEAWSVSPGFYQFVPQFDGKFKVVTFSGSLNTKQYFSFTLQYRKSKETAFGQSVEHKFFNSSSGYTFCIKTGLMITITSLEHLERLITPA